MPSGNPLSRHEVALVGSGYGYRELLPVLNSMEEVKTTFSLPHEYDKDYEKQISRLGLKTAELPDILGNKEIKLIFIAVPPYLQLSHGRAILENGKNLYCEKPAGVNYLETDSLFRIQSSTGKSVFVGFQFRFDPGIVALKELLESNLLGKMSAIEVDWHTSGTSASNNNVNWRNDINLGGGVHRDFLCHVIDYIKWITNSSTFLTLKNLSVDPNFKHSLFSTRLISDKPSSELIKINISRGILRTSFWKVSIFFESGQLSLSAADPFSLRSYWATFNGNKNFCTSAKKFVASKNFLNGAAGSQSARTYALRIYFKQIISNTFQNGENLLPNLEDAKFTQRISDNIQQSLNLC